MTLALLGADKKLAVGAFAPDVEGQDLAGHLLRLSDLKGRMAVVYFYPKDETPGCTKEACAFRDAFEKFQAAGVEIFGVSRDTPESHRKFQEHHKLLFYLVADPSGKVCDAYGVRSALRLAERVTFLVGPDRRVRYVWLGVNPALHAEEVLAKAQEK